MGLFKIKEIFLVDDDAIVRMVVCKILKGIGFQGSISVFENGKQAMEEISKRIENHDLEPDADQILMLLDINMPIMDAWEFLNEFEKLDSAVKDIFLISIITSSIDTSDKENALAYRSVSDYITKPLSGKHITDFLKNHSLWED